MAATAALAALGTLAGSVFVGAHTFLALQADLNSHFVKLRHVGADALLFGWCVCAAVTSIYSLIWVIL